ncbi:MAG: hypothetical protein ACXW16_06720, partial [Burkholderiaceae bacterium]
MNPGKPSDEYYFVALGRERGGFLDVLGLPPDTDETQIGRREAEYRLQILSDEKKQRKPWREKLQAKEITQEEFDAKAAEIKAEKDRREREFNELSGKYALLKADQRKLANEGRRDTSASWVEAFPGWGMDRPSFWSFLTAQRPLPQVDGALLNAIHERWLRSGLRGTLVSSEQADGQGFD